MKRQMRAASATVVLLLASAAVCAAQSGNLRAGAAKVDISPTKDMFPLTGGQAYGSLHDPLFARALVLDNGSRKVALVSVDATQVPYGDDVIRAVTAELGIPPENLILSATHDHNVPSGGAPGQAQNGSQPTYFDILKKGIVEAVKQANAHLQPARVGFGTGAAYINVNRDAKIGDGYHMGYAPEGPSDKTVAVMAVTTPSGDPIAIYANYAVHSVVMYRAHTKDGQVQVTGDLGGAASSYVEDRLKGAVALWTMAAAGDQNPLFMANYNQDAPDVFDEGPAGWAILDVQARRVGEEIVRVTKAMQNTAGHAVLWGARTSVTCPGQRWGEAPKPGTSNAKTVEGDPVKIPLSLVMINDIAITGVSGEVFTEIGQHVKRDSLFDRTMMVTTMPNGVGYIPTDRAFTLPSEKAVGNRLKPGCAEPALVGAFQGLMKDYLLLWKATK
jgi:neutral ceramidase